MRIGLVYYSLTGHTAKLARMIGDELGVDPFVINDIKLRKGFMGVMRSVWQTLFGIPVPLDLPDINYAEFDLLIVGSPMWVGQPCAPIQSYLHMIKDNHTPLAYFMMRRGGKPSKIDSQISDIYGQPPIACFELSETDLERGNTLVKIKNFLCAVKSKTTEHSADALGTNSAGDLQSTDA